MTKYLAFDIEIAKEIPEDCEEWKAIRPLGITCAAAYSSDDRLWNWHANDNGEFTDRMSPGRCYHMALELAGLINDGYTLLTWNGLSFDFDILAEESGEPDLCRSLALNHIDMMFQFLCSKGYPLGLDAAAQREYARAAMVREQSQARSDLMAGALPYVAITLVGVFGAVTMAIVVIVSVRWLGDDRARPSQPQYIIERHTVLVLPGGSSRRMMWQRLAESERKLIGGGR